MAKPLCKLTGKLDNDIFSIVAEVSETLKKANKREKAKEFRELAYKCTSKNQVFALIHKYVSVI